MSGTDVRALLLVEDDPNDVYFFRLGLEKAGLAGGLQVAQDGEEAVDYIDGRGRYENRTLHPLPALIVLDLKLPKKGGLEVLRWLREESRLKEIPVIILTSSKQPNDVATAGTLGVTAYQIKPADFLETRDLVRSIGLVWAKLTGNVDRLKPVASKDLLKKTPPPASASL
jgi:CheY-like chemotaxis protein